MASPSGKLRRLRTSIQTLVLLWLAVPAALFAATGPVVISEFVAENGGELRDFEGDTPDWIELHNISTNVVDLSGWRLTDTSTNLAQWTFPSVTLPPDGYLVVFASSKNRAFAGAELHTNFDLDKRGEYLALVQPDGSIADEFSPASPPQRLNISYGRETHSANFLSLDFNDDDSGETGAANTEPGFSSVTLSSNPATINGVKVWLERLGGGTLDDRDRDVPLPTATLTQDQLYDDFIYATGTNNGQGIRVRLTGLPPNQDFTLKIWSCDPGGTTPGNRISEWIETASGLTNMLNPRYVFDVTVPLTVDGQNTFTAPVRTTAAGELQIEGRRIGGVSSGVYLNALQLIQERVTDPQAEDVLRYFRPATPGAPNGAGYVGVVEDTKFSVDRGFYSEPFTVAISTATPGAKIYWTTNSSTPTPSNGYLCTGPVPINGTTLLRAAAFLDGYLPSDVDTHSYIFLSQVLQQAAVQPGYPTTWQASYPADYGMDPNVVNHPKYSQTISNDMQALPIISIVSDHDGFWGPVNGIYNHATSLGPQWEKPTSVELFRPDGRTEFVINCGIEMQGGASRDNVRTPKHSFRLSFVSKYGPTKLNYDWFGGPVRQFDTIVLRAIAFVDSWPTRYSDTTPIPGTGMIGTRYRPETATYLRDGWMKASFRDMGHLAARGDYAHVYLNGLYWGLYNPSERLDASFFASHLGGRVGDWDVMAGDETYNFAELRDGTKAAWSALTNLVTSGITDVGKYQAVADLVDLENLADYMMLHMFAEAEDWPFHNWYAARRRETNGVPATKWIFSVWDQDIVLDRLVRRDRVDVNYADTPSLIYAKLREFPEFRVLFGDRIQKHMLGQGALSPENNVARFKKLAARIERALTGESARWGDAREFTIGANPGTGKTFTPDEWWRPELEKLYTNFFPTLNSINLSRFRSRGLYPNINAPELSHPGGPVPAEFQLTISNPNPSGTVFYTTDGSDPRTPFSGAAAPGASAYDSPIGFNTSTIVRARVLNGTEWSALVEGTYYLPQDLSALALTEIMYNPLPLGATNGEEFEFIELKNRGTNTLNLSGLTFSQGINYTFPNGSFLEPGSFWTLARNAAAFSARYPGKTPQGIYSGRLDNGGETLALAHPGGAVVFSVTFADAPPWPAAADGYGFSLVPRSGVAGQAPEGGLSWRASAHPGGSPGADDPEPAIPQIVINEILAHTDPPQLDAIELFNPTEAEADLGGWLLTDDRGQPWKYSIPQGTRIQPRGYLVIDSSQFNSTPGAVTSFSLSSTGEDVYLFSAGAGAQLTGYSHAVSFGATFNGDSLGRVVNEAGDESFPIQITNTLGAANSGPRIGPVAMTEIQYHPLAGWVEFIELLNTGASPVPLFDPAAPTNSWKLSGASFSFPTNFVLAPGGMVLLVATNPAVFKATYAIPEEVAVLGPFAGTLQDSGESLELQAPDHPNTNGTVPYVTVERVRYNDKSPWPTMADGSGLSLQRRSLSTYADTPSNWLAAEPTPGRLLGTADSDGDGLPDDWERANGTNPFVPDADLDPDHDGFTNWQEYLAGTDPQSATSALVLRSTLTTEGTVKLEFEAMASHTYTVLYSETLGEWSKLTDIPSTETNRVETINPGPLTGSRFYRVLTPAIP